MVSAILNHDNVDANIKNIAGSSALDVARNCGRVEIASLLEQHQAHLSVHRKDAKGKK